MPEFVRLQEVVLTKASESVSVSLRATLLVCSRCAFRLESSFTSTYRTAQTQCVVCVCVCVFVNL